MRFAWIQQNAERFEVKVMCQTLGVSRQGYYAWEKRPAAATLRRQQLLGQIRQVHADSGQTYGSPRIRVELAERRIACCVNTVAKLMKAAGIRACNAARFVPQTTDSKHERPVFENILNQEFTAAWPNQKWMAAVRPPRSLPTNR